VANFATGRLPIWRLAIHELAFDYLFVAEPLSAPGAIRSERKFGGREDRDLSGGKIYHPKTAEKKAATGFADRDLSGGQIDLGDKRNATAKAIAAEFGVGERTVRNAAAFTEAVESKPSDLKARKCPPED